MRKTCAATAMILFLISSAWSFGCRNPSAQEAGQDITAAECKKLLACDAGGNRCLVDHQLVPCADPSFATAYPDGLSECETNNASAVGGAGSCSQDDVDTCTGDITIESCETASVNEESLPHSCDACF